MKKVIIFLLILLLALSSVSARSHYVMLTPAIARIQIPTGTGYEIGIQEFSFFWGAGQNNNREDGRRHGGYRAQRYNQQSITGSDTRQKPISTIGLHFALDYGTLNGNYYGSYTTSVIQVYTGAAFRQQVMDSFFIYETAGITLGSATMGLYSGAGLLYESSLGFIADIGLQLELGNSQSDSSFAIAIKPYASVGWAFGK